LAKLRIEDGMSLEAFFRELTETSAATLHVERVGVWLLIDHGRALRCVELFEQSKGTHSAGATLQASDFPAYFAALAQRKTLPAEVAVSDPRTTGLADEYLVPLGITSLLDATVFVGGEVIGVVCHEHIGSPREWSTEERDFAGSMADVVALKIRAAELEEAKVALRTQESHLAESRRLDSLAELAAGVAHDFNNVLTAIIGYAEIILQDRSAAKVAEYAQHIVGASSLGINLAKELMEFARPMARSSRIVRPAEIIAAQKESLQDLIGDRHRLVLEVKSEVGRVLIAPHQLERMVINLVSNARDAMPDGGDIRVTIGTVQDHDEDGNNGRYFLLEVADQGSGIAPSIICRIFDPFFTTKPRGQGTGLGLAVVHQIAKHAGGFIRIETAVGKGSTFRVFLPLASCY
jgi:signal transduction histidine kinase